LAHGRRLHARLGVAGSARPPAAPAAAPPALGELVLAQRVLDVLVGVALVHVLVDVFHVWHQSSPLGCGGSGATGVTAASCRASAGPTHSSKAARAGRR